MKITADTSVLVASFATWHEQHVIAAAAMRRVEVVVAHCLLETYSVLTRLPAPHRMAPDVVARFIDLAFADHLMATLGATDQRELVARCAAEGLSGGAVYDALIAATCVEAKLKLLTLDARARPTYAILGANHEIIA